MIRDNFDDAALVLLGHGSMLNADSCEPVHRHADAFRRQNLFAEVQELFWKNEPAISGIWRQVFSPRIFLVPLFISEGYFTQQVIPRELGLLAPNGRHFLRVYHSGDQRLYYGNPVGTHPSMKTALANLVTDVLDGFPFPSRPPDAEISLFVAGHGTATNDNSRTNIERQAELLRATGRYCDVQAVFMEEEPRIPECYRLAPSRHVVVVPFFISDGLHSFEDIPVMLGEPQAKVARRLAEGKSTWRNPTERHGKLLWYTKSVGWDPGMQQVIMERVRESAVWNEEERSAVGRQNRR